ncbi:MAG: hypothetical protein AMXMBFR8_12280 [Nevskiales bacterium]
MVRGARLLGLSLGCLWVGALAVADAAMPEEQLLEFLGTWSDEESADDWLEFLGDAPDPEREPPADDAGDALGVDDEARR